MFIITLSLNVKTVYIIFLQDGKQPVSYKIHGKHIEDLVVDSSGNIKVLRSLDRETLDRGMAIVKIVAEDFGSPPLSSTATLSVSLSDVNDCPPEINPPRTLHVVEGSMPGMVGVITATDRDVWALGNGPPFQFSLASTNSPEVMDLIALKMDPRKYIFVTI